MVSSLAADGAPQSAVVGIATSESGEIVFDTLGTSRKARNLRRDPRVSLVVWENERTVQLEGLADEPTGAELDRLREIYFAVYPDGRERLAWPGLTHFRIVPRWAPLLGLRGSRRERADRRARSGRALSRAREIR